MWTRAAGRGATRGILRTPYCQGHHPVVDLLALLYPESGVRCSHSGLLRGDRSAVDERERKETGLSSSEAAAFWFRLGRPGERGRGLYPIPAPVLSSPRVILDRRFLIVDSLQNAREFVPAHSGVVVLYEAGRAGWEPGIGPFPDRGSIW